MAVDLLEPRLLLLLVPLAVYVVLALGRPGRRDRGSVAARLLLFALLLAALAGPGYYRGSTRRAVVFVLDRSASVSTDTAAMDRFVRSAASGLRPGDLIAVVATGERAVVGLPPAPGLPAGPLDLPDPGPDFSDLAAGLRLAGGLMPDDYRRQAILVSDGRETTGNAAAEAAALAARGIRVDVVPAGVPREPDVRLEALSAPDPLFEGEALSITLALHASRATGATLRIYADRELVHQQDLRLAAGPGGLTVKLDPPATGVHTYRAVIEAPGDAVSQNDQAAAVVRVLGQPRILLAEAAPADGADLAAALTAAGWPVDRRAPGALPSDPAELRAWGAVFLANVPAEALSVAQMEALETYVRDLGGGLAMVGGEKGFGLGAWHDTPVERALPVTMSVQGQGEVASVGLVLVIDRSASMAGGDPQKMELAKEGAIRAAELLTPTDQVGVVGFDLEAGWVYPMATADQPLAAGGAIGSLEPQGGTNLFAGLALAERGLAPITTRVKHMIVLTDGRSAFGGDYESLLGRLREGNITLSAVAVGEDADRLLLQQLAEQGGGRFHYTSEPQDIPRILTQETLAAARSYVVETDFRPRPAARSSILQGLESPPPLHGYVATTARPAAEVVFTAPGRDPVLATWRYGLGRSAAWTSDLKGRWASDWIASPALGQLAANLAGWLVPGAGGDLQIATSHRPGTGSVTVVRTLPAAGPPAESEPLTAIITGPDGTDRPAELLPVAPGRYRGEFPARQSGTYLVRVEGGPPGVPAGLVVPYSPEYRAMGRDDRALESVAAAGGGVLLAAPGEALRTPLPPSGARADLSAWALAAALLLVPLDIAVRRGLIARLVAVALARFTVWRATRAAAARAAAAEAGVAPPAGAPPATAGPEGTAAPDAPAQPADQRQRINRLLAAKRRRQM